MFFFVKIQFYQGKCTWWQNVFAGQKSNNMKYPIEILIKMNKGITLI